MPSIGSWIRRKLDSTHERRAGLRQPQLREQVSPCHEDEVSLPCLPPVRPQRLTPRSSSDNGDQDCSRALQNYGLMGCVPYEVRRRILIEAFGQRRLHVDLSYRHPLVRRHEDQGSPGPSASAELTTATRHRHCGLGSNLVEDACRPRQWQWFSCVCHRRVGYSRLEMEQRYAGMELSQSIEPCDDGCLEGSESMCSCTSQSSDIDGTPSECFVGAMGWLLACRQAYVDGIGVVYGTNTFHLSSLDLQLNLPRLLPQPHLARVKSLELLWKLNGTARGGTNKTQDHVKSLWDSSQDSTQKEASPLHDLCDLMPSTFPDLRSLYISFQCWLDSGSPRGRASSDVISQVEAIFLGPVEDMLRMYFKHSRQEHVPDSTGDHHSLELNVAVQQGAWRVLLAKYHKLFGPKLRVESVDELTRGRFWKPLSNGAGHDVAGPEELEGSQLGYWICGGWEDIKTFGHDYWTMTNWGDRWTGPKTTF